MDLYASRVTRGAASSNEQVNARWREEDQQPLAVRLERHLARELAEMMPSTADLPASAAATSTTLRLEFAPGAPNRFESATTISETFLTSGFSPQA